MPQNPTPMNCSPSVWGTRILLCTSLATQLGTAADFTLAPQRFHQEMAHIFTENNGLPSGPVQLVDAAPDGMIRAFSAGRWYELHGDRWSVNEALTSPDNNRFVFPNTGGKRIEVLIPWREVRQILHVGSTDFILAGEPLVLAQGKAASLGWKRGQKVNQMAASSDGILHIAASSGLFR